MKDKDEIIKMVLENAKRELRVLCSQGKAEQALDMAEALRNIPSTLARSILWSEARFIDKISMCACSCQI